MYKEIKENSAMDFIKVRRRSRCLSDIDITDELPNNSIEPGENDPLRIELYLDETGIAGINNKFSIGGIYVIGEESAWERYIDISDDYAWALSPYNRLTRERESILGKLDDNHIEKLWWDNWEITPQQEGRDEDERRKNKIRTVSLYCLEELMGRNDLMNNFEIHAIELTETVDHTNRKRQERELIEGALHRHVPQNLVNNILREVQRPPVDFIDIKLGRALTNRRDILAGIDLGIIEQNARLREAIVGQYVNTTDKHKEILQKLVELFLHVILPRRTKVLDGISIKIRYGTIKREPYIIIADAVEDRRSYSVESNQKLPGNRYNLFVIRRDTLDINNIGYSKGGSKFGYEAISTGGRTNPEFSKLHHIADAVLSRPNHRTQELYNGPYGMSEKFDDSLKYFTDANKYLYAGDLVKAFSAILNDAAKETLKEALNQPKNSGRYYICTRLKQDCPKASKPNEFYELVREVRRLNNENRNNADTTNTAANAASSGSANSSKNQTNGNSETAPKHQSYSDGSAPEKFYRSVEEANVENIQKKDAGPYREGKIHFDGGEYEEAIVEYKKATDKWASHPSIKKQPQCGPFDCRIKNFGLTITIEANLYGAHIQIGVCNLLLAESLQEKEKYKEALEKYEQACEACGKIPKSEEGLYRGVQGLIALVYKKMQSCCMSLSVNNNNARKSKEYKEKAQKCEDEYKKILQKYKLTFVEPQTQS